MNNSLSLININSRQLAEIHSIYNMQYFHFHTWGLKKICASCNMVQKNQASGKEFTFL